MLYQGSGRVFKVLSKIVVHAARDRGGLHRGLDYAKEESGGEKFLSLRATPGRTKPTRWIIQRRGLVKVTPLRGPVLRVRRV